MAAHPRECGDDGMRRMTAGSDSGSPPRMRGRLNFVIFTVKVIRLTPANARTTGYLPLEVFAPKAHPRECGDDLSA